MTRSEQLRAMEERVRALLREVYVHGLGRIGHAELAMSLGRERATKGFHGDIQRLWTNEMELLGYDDADMPKLRYAWTSNGDWIFVFKGTREDEKFDWLTV